MHLLAKRAVILNFSLDTSAKDMSLKDLDKWRHAQPWPRRYLVAIAKGRHQHNPQRRGSLNMPRLYRSPSIPKSHPTPLYLTSELCDLSAHKPCQACSECSYMQTNTSRALSA